jgi:2-amino-4-hydroxy-6-hydroxymethyldihydropteridine diphosphokinase
MQVAYIGMGGNVAGPAGPPEATLAAAAERLEQLGRVACRSSLYSTEPVGYAAQPRFVNAVAALETSLSPRELLESLLRIEREFGRDRFTGIPNGPRTLDLDLLLLGDMVLHQWNLDLPHPRLAEREFVLVPLNEIASNLVVATRQRTVKQLLESLPLGEPNQSDAILPLQSHLWSPGPCGRDGVRTGARHADG